MLFRSDRKSTRLNSSHTLISYALPIRSEEHTSELQSHSHLVCRLLLEKKNANHKSNGPPQSPPSCLGSLRMADGGCMTRYCRSVLKLACAAGAILLFLSAPHVLMAQDAPKGSPDVKQLNDRVELLEQTIKELKDQLTAIEEAKKNPKVEVIDATYKGDSSTPTGTLTTGSTAVPAKKKAEDVND